MWSYLFGRDEDETVDVESEQTLLPPVYDLAKASNLMDECERHVNFQQPDEGNPDWEDHISKYDFKPFKWEEGYYNMKYITRALDLGDCKNGAVKIESHWGKRTRSTEHATGTLTHKFPPPLLFRCGVPLHISELGFTSCRSVSFKLMYLCWVLLFNWILWDWWFHKLEGIVT